MFGDVFFETIWILKGEVVLFLEFRFYINIDVGRTTCSYVFRQRFFRVNFFHPSPVAGPRGGDPFHPRG